MSESLPCLMRKLAPGKLALAPSLLPFFRSCTLAEQARWGRLGPAGEPRCTEGSQMIVPLPDKDQDSWQARTSLTTTQRVLGGGEWLWRQTQPLQDAQQSQSTF